MYLYVVLSLPEARVERAARRPRGVGVIGGWTDRVEDVVPLRGLCLKRVSLQTV